MVLTEYIIDMVNASLKTAARPAIIADMRRCAIGMLESTIAFVAMSNTRIDITKAQALYGDALERVTQKYLLVGATGVVKGKAVFKLKAQIDYARVCLADTIASIGRAAETWGLSDDIYTYAVIRSLELSCEYLKSVFKTHNTTEKYHTAMVELAREVLLW